MNRNHQLEAKLAFGIAVLAQGIALLVPGKDEPALLWQLLEDARKYFSSDPEFVVIVASLLLGPNLLWLVSPFLTRVYGQSKAVLSLALVLSGLTFLALGFLFLMAVVMKIFALPLAALLLAASAHLVGMFRIRKEGPDEDPML